jgi:hypothetical protein
LILDFQPPKPQDNKLLLFKTPVCDILCRKPLLLFLCLSQFLGVFWVTFKTPNPGTARSLTSSLSPLFGVSHLASGEMSLMSLSVRPTSHGMDEMVPFPAVCLYGGAWEVWGMGSKPCAPALESSCQSRFASSAGLGSPHQAAKWFLPSLA